MLISTIIVLVLSCITQVVGEGFFEVPESQTVYLNDEAVFRCRHTSVDHGIQWRVNGKIIDQQAPPELDPGITRDEDDNIVDTLTITATQDYNNSEVVCVATLDTQSHSLSVQPEFTRVATLRVLPRISGFTLSPISQVVLLGATAIFTCQHRDGDIAWRINGQRVNDPNVVTTSTMGVHMLMIMSAWSTYNGSMIQCRASFDDGRESELTTLAILQLQGMLESVSNVCVARDTSTLSWTPPFSLDLTGVDADIIYCVDIYNITCGRRNLIVSDCNVTEPSYTFDVPHGYIYEYIVTPRSNVPLAGNGTSSYPLRERFSRFKDPISERNNIPTMNFQLAFVNLEPSLPVPLSYTVLLETLDGLKSMELKTTSIATEGDVIVVDVNQELPLNRLWNCTLWAYNCRQNTILRGIELSTHDVQNISVSSHLPSQLRVTGDFIDGSMATGVLVAVVNGATDVQHHLISREDSVNGIDGVISGLPGGQYTVSVFVVGEDRLPFERVAATPRRAFVENATGPIVERSSPTIEYTLEEKSSSVCITCTFLDSSDTDCVAVVHQRISQLSYSGLMNITSYKFTRSGDTAYECIEGVNLEDHEVQVLDGQRINQQVTNRSTCTGIGCIAALVTAVLAVSFILVSSAIIAILLKIRYCNRTSSAKRGQSDMKSLDKDAEEGHSGRAKSNYYAEMPTSKSSEEEREAVSVKAEAHGSGETQPIFPPTSSPVSMIPQTPDVEGTVIATPEARETELDHPDTPRPEAQCAKVNMKGSKTPKVPCEDGTTADGKQEQDTPFYSSSPPKENLLPQSLVETDPAAPKKQLLDKEALPLDKELDNLHINNESEAELKPEENMEAISEEGDIKELQDESDNTERATFEDEVKAKDNQTEGSEDKTDSTIHTDEMVNDVPTENDEETSPQSAFQVIGASQGCQMGVLSKSDEETQPLNCLSTKESASDDNLDTTFISGNDSHIHVVVVPCEDQTTVDGEQEQDTSVYSSSPPKENLLPQSLLETDPTAPKEQPLDEEALPLDIELVSRENKEACTAAELKPEENMKAISEEGNIEELQNEPGDTERTFEDKVKAKDNPTEGSEDKIDSTTHTDEMVNDVPAEDNEETSPQSAVQVIGASQGCQMYKSDEEMQPLNCLSTEETASDSNVDTAFISGNKSHKYPKPLAHSTPLKRRLSICDASGSVSSQYAADSLIVQNSQVYECAAGYKVSEGSTYITKLEDANCAQNEDCTSAPQPISSKGASHKLEDDSAYKTYSMPGDDEDHSSEPYSELSDIGHNVPVETMEKNETVCGSGKVPSSTLIDNSDGMTFCPEGVEEQTTNGSRQQTQLMPFTENPEEDSRPLVPPQQLDHVQQISNQGVD